MIRLSICIVFLIGVDKEINYALRYLLRLERCQVIMRLLYFILIHWLSFPFSSQLNPLILRIPFISRHSCFSIHDLCPNTMQSFSLSTSSFANRLPNSSITKKSLSLSLATTVISDRISSTILHFFEYSS